WPHGRDRRSRDPGAGGADQLDPGNAHRDRTYAVRFRRGGIVLKQAVILVGGLGTRLGEMTRLVPKPLLEVAGKPFLDYILDELSRCPTIQDIVLLAGHQAGQVIGRYDCKRWRSASISVISEPAPLGTGGALKHAA